MQELTTNNAKGISAMLFNQDSSHISCPLQSGLRTAGASKSLPGQEPAPPTPALGLKPQAPQSRLLPGPAYREHDPRVLAGLAHSLRTKLSRVAPAAPEGPDGQSIQTIQFFIRPVLLILLMEELQSPPYFTQRKQG